ncbi:Hypothetical predicted protein [Lecanosticta acicola]|uniref:Uncharacterized protein n=1 Tax=Lecanosticta acicola TaxID=111012 RepID=A0AAI9EB15_9PEZI|nr:Hypothetical predicted protein [Lecanosticta acicola]
MNGPIRSFNLINRHTFSTKDLELQQNQRTILWIHVNTGFLSKPQLNLHQNGPSGPIVASAKLRNFSSGIQVSLGGGPWADVPAEGFITKQYPFYFGDRKFVWRRTRDGALGASTFGAGDFKLLDASNEGVVLAVWISDNKWFNMHEIGRVDWFVDLGRDLEVFALIVILGIGEKLRRDSSGAAGGASGGGGGGG